MGIACMKAEQKGKNNKPVVITKLAKELEI